MADLALPEADGSHYYLENYANYERQNPRRKLDFYLELAKKWIPAGGSLYELGVGLGYFIKRASGYYRCIGSDINPYGVAQARKHAPLASISEGSIDRLTACSPIDGVVAWDVLEHLPHISLALDAIRSSLVPGGVLVAVVPVYDGPLGWLVRILDHDPTHVSKWSRDEWKRTLRTHGFEVVASGGIIRRLIFGRWYLHVTGRSQLLSRVGSAIWIAARRTD